jgi:3-oxoacyl-[acyl-carrier-protein] synthase I
MTPTRAPILIGSHTLTSAVGRGSAALLAALRVRRSGLKPCDFRPHAAAARLSTWIGEVAGVDDIVLPAGTERFDCRNNRLAWLGLQQDGFLAAARAAVARHGAARVAVILGTSTAGLLQAEQAYRQRDADGRLPGDFDYAATLNNFSLPAFVAQVTGAAGPAYAISTACSSSAKVFPAAARLIHAGLVDAAIVGGVDSLCEITLNGFGSLELLSPEPCRPYDLHRSGISIGEGAGFALVERGVDAGAVDDDAIVLLGAGESSDGHHMSTPHPEGRGAELAMRGALAAAGLAPAQVDYINLHGTATRSNDPSEGRAVHAVFGRAVPTSSTKAWFGHLLGAAGIAESVVTLLALQHGLLPGTLNTTEVDPACPNQVLLDNQQQRCEIALTNSFGFGGSNCSLVFGTGRAWAGQARAGE